MGVAGKRALWQSLQSVPGLSERLSGFDLDHLAERARRQRDESKSSASMPPARPSARRERPLRSVRAGGVLRRNRRLAAGAPALVRVGDRPEDGFLVGPDGWAYRRRDRDRPCSSCSPTARCTAELRTVAATSAAGLALVDLSFVARGRISKIYLADAAAEVALVGGWLLPLETDPSLVSPTPRKEQGCRADASRLLRRSRARDERVGRMARAIRHGAG